MIEAMAAVVTVAIISCTNIVMRSAKMKDKKYNHAFSIAWSLDSQYSPEEWEKRLATKEGISEACAHLIKRVQQVIKDTDHEAIELWDSYENE